MEYEYDSDTICNCYARYSPQSIDKGTKRIRNNWKCGDYPNDSIIKISQNILKSPGDLRRFNVTQTLVEDY